MNMFDSVYDAKEDFFNTENIEMDDEEDQYDLSCNNDQNQIDYCSLKIFSA